MRRSVRHIDECTAHAPQTQNELVFQGVGDRDCVAFAARRIQRAAGPGQVGLASSRTRQDECQRKAGKDGARHWFARGRMRQRVRRRWFEGGEGPVVRGKAKAMAKQRNSKLKPF